MNNWQRKILQELMGVCNELGGSLDYTATPSLPKPEGEKSGVELIAEERQRQKDVEGWTAEHDAKNVNDEMARAAAVYALPWPLRHPRLVIEGGCPEHWPIQTWAAKWFKPAPKNALIGPERIRELVKAGALVAAEIDRLQGIQPPLDNVHVQLPSGAIANVSPNASPELLDALDRMAELAMNMPEPSPKQEPDGPVLEIPVDVMAEIEAAYKNLPTVESLGMGEKGWRGGACWMYRKANAQIEAQKEELRIAAKNMAGLTDWWEAEKLAKEALKADLEQARVKIKAQQDWHDSHLGGHVA